jgi:hypothetical protein
MNFQGRQTSLRRGKGLQHIVRRPSDDITPHHGSSSPVITDKVITDKVATKKGVPSHV